MSKGRAAQKHVVLLQGQEGSKPVPICQHLNPHARSSNSPHLHAWPSNSPQPTRLAQQQPAIRTLARATDRNPQASPSNSLRPAG